MAHKIFYRSRAADLTKSVRFVALAFFVTLGLSAVPETSGPGFGTSTAMAKMARDTVWLVTATGEQAISVEMAVTPEESAVGLMFRTELGEGDGMLFPSPAPREVTMWMRNTFIPLDMVFIRADGIIHRIEAMTEPMSQRIIESRGPVLAVLELKGGASARLGLKPGDRVRHRLFGASK